MENAAPNFRGWSTPILIEAAGRKELVVNGHTGVTAYDPASGKELWFCKSFNGRGEPTITPAGELLCAVNGLAGDIYAIRPGGEGDVTGTRMAWQTPRPRRPRYAFAHRHRQVHRRRRHERDRLLLRQRERTRIVERTDVRCDFIVTDRRGGLGIFPGEKERRRAQARTAARSRLTANARHNNEIFRASLAPLDGKLLSRSQTTLYCIGGEGKN